MERNVPRPAGSNDTETKSKGEINERSVRQEEENQDSEADVQTMEGTQWLKSTTSMADSRQEMFGTRPMTTARYGDSL